MHPEKSPAEENTSQTLQALMLDLLQEILVRSDDLEELGSYLTEKLGDLTGAGRIYLLQSMKGLADMNYCLVSPGRDEGVDQDQVNMLLRLGELLQEFFFPQVWTWKNKSCGEAEKILMELGSHRSMGVPLMVGQIRAGGLLLLDIPENQNLNRLAGMMSTLSSAVALVLRNSYLYDKSETLLRQAMDLVPHRIFAKDRHGRFLLVNRATADLYGMSVNELTGKLEADIHPRKEELERFTGEDLEVMESGRPKFIPEETLMDVAGNEKIYQTFKMPFATRGGEEPAVLGVSVDITELKRAEEHKKNLEVQMQQAQKLESLGVLAGGIAHDFNNLLVGILGHADLTLMDLPKRSPLRGNLQELKKAALQASDLTHQLLAYSGRGRFLIEPISLNEVIKDMKNLLEVSISKKVVLEYEFLDALPAIEGDTSQIRQVVMNLVTNASDAYGNKSGHIRIRTGLKRAESREFSDAFPNREMPAGLYVFLEVSDAGCGMDRETKSRVFDPFFTTKFAGRGLGLAVVLGIVRSHRGAIKVHSRKGYETTFQVLFPLSVRTPVSIKKESSVSKATRKNNGTILVVDDEEGIRYVARRMLERYGYRTLLAADGVEALELFQRYQKEISAVVLDMTMPRMSGEETLHELKKIRSDVKVLLCSGYHEQDAVSQFSGLGLAGFLQKPFEITTLIQKVQSMLEPGKAGSQAGEF